MTTITYTVRCIVHEGAVFPMRMLWRDHSWLARVGDAMAIADNATDIDIKLKTDYLVHVDEWQKDGGWRVVAIE